MTVAVAGSGADPCGPGYLVPLSASAVPVPPDLSKAGADAQWAAEVHGVPSVQSGVTFTVQGRSDAVVTLLGMDIEVVRREAAPHGTHVSWVCGSGVAYRWVHVDLDTIPPGLTAQFNESEASSAPQAERRPIRFPYQVSRTDPESFEVDAGTSRCDCSWRIKLRWTSEGRSGIYVIDDDGRPFRTVGTANADASCQLGPDWSCGPPVKN
ncbi:hypothetical protein ACPB67_31885 [Micromonospora taraxaci]|uniref:hypothetical protein n=1 Tax=Micromonospora taraxaci TaxID=1316803 RepID=UPI003C2CEE09